MKLERIQDQIVSVRGQRILFDFQLAALYEVETRALKQAVRRNKDRFPNDFMFELSKEEWQEVITTCDNLLPSTARFAPATPYAFTEQGVAMLSSVLRSPKAIEINISIMRAFVVLRQYLSDYKDLKEQIQALEKGMDTKFADVYQALDYLVSPKNQRRTIGFKPDVADDNDA